MIFFYTYYRIFVCKYCFVGSCFSSHSLLAAVLRWFGGLAALVLPVWLLCPPRSPLPAPRGWPLCSAHLGEYPIPSFLHFSVHSRWEKRAFMLALMESDCRMERMSSMVIETDAGCGVRANACELSAHEELGCIQATKQRHRTLLPPHLLHTLSLLIPPCPLLCMLRVLQGHLAPYFCGLAQRNPGSCASWCSAQTSQSLWICAPSAYRQVCVPWAAVLGAVPMVRVLELFSHATSQRHYRATPRMFPL